MNRQRVWWFALFAAILLAVPAAAQDAEEDGEFFLKAGDRVVFLGDSITFQKLHTKYIEDFTQAFFGDLGVEFFNEGVNGDTAPGALERLDEDVLAHNPTVVTVCFGMNDSRIWPKDLQKYHDATTQIVQRCKAAGARVVLLTPPCADDSREFGWVERSNKPPDLNTRLWAFGRKAFEVGEEQDVPVIDIFHPLLRAMHKGQARDRDVTLIPDFIHPNQRGHYVIAMTILEAWNWRSWDKTR